MKLTGKWFLSVCNSLIAVQIIKCVDRQKKILSNSLLWKLKQLINYFLIKFDQHSACQSYSYYLRKADKHRLSDICRQIRWNWIRLISQIRTISRHQRIHCVRWRIDHILEIRSAIKLWPLVVMPSFNVWSKIWTITKYVSRIWINLLKFARKVIN